MLDLKYVLAHAAAVKQNCVDRALPGDVVDEVDRVVEVESRRKVLLHDVEAIRG